MQAIKLIQSLNKESEESNDTPHTPRAGMSGQFQYAN